LERAVEHRRFVETDQTMTPGQQAESVGMHHDAMAGFALEADTASRRLVVARNNE
jgi:hypothetical protein